MNSISLPTIAEDMFCYGVYTASHIINRSYTPLLKPLGLTYPQYITLTLLWEENDQKVTALSEKLCMGTNTLTPLLKRLEKSELVTRTRGVEDGREIYVRLTAKGEELQKEASRITACIVEGASLEQSELTELQRLLGKLSSNLSKEA